MRVAACLVATLLAAPAFAQSTTTSTVPVQNMDEVTGSACFERLRQVVPGLEASLSAGQERELRQLIRPAIILARRGNEPACEAIVEEIEAFGSEEPAQAEVTSAPAATSAPAGATMAIVVSEDLVDREIVGAAGDEIGDIEDILLFTGAEGRAYAVVDRDGWFNAGADTIAIPLDALETTGTGDVLLGVPEEVVDQAPAVDMRSAAGIEEIDAFWANHAR